jgi:hypothetical protein
MHCAGLAKYRDSKPKCWFFDPRKLEQESCVLHNLADFDIDTMNVVIGFFSVVGAKANAAA